MSEFKGTPGEWNFIATKVGFSSFYINSEQGDYIGELGSRYQSDDEIEANARLISAAPDMLSVLKELMLEYNNKGQLLNFDVNKAREVIKKVLGKEAKI